MSHSLLLSAAVLLSACGALPRPPEPAPPEPAPPAAAPVTVIPALPEPPALPAVSVPAPALQAVSWEVLPGWGDADFTAAWSAFLGSCQALKSELPWQEVCLLAAATESTDDTALRRFFESRFTPHQVLNPDGSDSGLITGYYEPLLKGSRFPTQRFRFPVYGVPEDLLTIDLAGLHPGLKNLRLRGRVLGNRVIPYFNRAQIEEGEAPVKGRELLWVDDPVELFFLQIQGSGRVRLDSGEVVRLGYADQNGHPYRSIGRLLVERGELTLNEASMQGIKAWGRRNPDKLSELLNQNPSYVFFRELPKDLPGPLGSLGVPLTAGRSLAIDPRVIPQGAPVFLSTTWPNSSKPLNRLMLAQDTGGAIRGAVRADFFWGFGEEAGNLAGKMKQAGELWVLLPNGYPLDAGTLKKVN